MKNTLETIIEIEAQIKEGYTRITLRPQDEYNEVDWDEIARYFKTDDINGYTQGDKVVIRLPGDPDLPVPEPYVKARPRRWWEYLIFFIFALGAFHFGRGVVDSAVELYQFIKSLFK